MAIIVSTASPYTLLSAIKLAIDARNIETWEYDSDGDFIHSPPQWKGKAWLRPVVQESRLILRIMTPQGTHMSRTVYAVYHGRFIEMLLTHFDTSFSRADASALPELGDIVSPPT